MYLDDASGLRPSEIAYIESEQMKIDKTCLEASGAYL